MGKIAFIFLALLAALIWFKLKARQARGRDKDSVSDDHSKKERRVEHMVACAHCGLHVPGDEAVFDAGGRAFCSGAHADARSPRT